MITKPNGGGGALASALGLLSRGEAAEADADVLRLRLAEVRVPPIEYDGVGLSHTPSPPRALPRPTGSA